MISDIKNYLIPHTVTTTGGLAALEILIVIPSIHSGVQRVSRLADGPISARRSIRPAQGESIDEIPFSALLRFSAQPFLPEYSLPTIPIPQPLHIRSGCWLDQ